VGDTVTDGYGAKTSILVVDHDAAMVESVATVLRHEGFEVHVALDGYAGLQKTQAGSFELVVFDVTLPDLGGLEIARRIRAEGIDVPILFLTARSGAEGRVAGLTIWGDDYLSKPFSLVEIVSRANAILGRRRYSEKEETPRLADLAIDVETHEAWRAGNALNLTRTEFNLLYLFLLNPNRVLSPDEIVDHVWHYDFEGRVNIVSTYVHYVRKKLNAHGVPLIHTIRQAGYVLREP
jgi:two-component system OmpR family response regulator